MNIQFDLNHPVDINFFKKAIVTLKSQNHNIFITYRDRGKLGVILKHELNDFNCFKIGIHYKKFYSKLFGQLYRDFLIYKFQRLHKIKMCVCFGSTSAIASFLNNVPYLAFDDDYEYKIPFYHANIFATRHIMPDYITFNNKKTWKYRGFKELAYLHPQNYRPSIKTILDLGLESGKYVFIRIIANVSLNYKNENNDFIKVIDYLNKVGLNTVVSLEDDLLKKELMKKSFVLNEPVKDFPSVLSFARFSISFGDTMARESCLLGTPCIYTGKREMLMNNELIKLGVMFKEDTFENIIKRINFLNNNFQTNEIKKSLFNEIKNKWQNTSNVIIEHINYFIGK